MQIHIIRHGPSAHASNERMSVHAFDNWIIQYDNAGIKQSEASHQARVKAEESNIVMTSHIKRSKQSASFLCGDLVQMRSFDLFREAQLPKPPVHFTFLKLRAGTWLMILRVVWFMGYSYKVESFKAAKDRAIKGADLLEDYATNYETVTLVGHGVFNLLLIRELKRRNWNGRNQGNRHWGCTTLSKEHHAKLL